MALETRTLRAVAGSVLLLGAAFVFVAAVRTESDGLAQLGVLLVVDSTGDGDNVAISPTDCDDGTGHCTLRAAIEVSNLHPGMDGIVINIPTTDPGYSNGVWTINVPRALPDISDGVTISGPGADQLIVQRSHLAGTPQFRLFNISTTGLVTISDLTVENGNTTGNGGNVQNFGTGTLTMTNCHLVGGSANAGGGINNNSSGTINLTNCTINSNVATFGGGVGSNGSSGTINISSSTINGNFANGGGGGAIEDFDGTVSVVNSTLSGNTAVHTSGNSDGGGIFTDFTTPVVNVINSTLSGNNADHGGGIEVFEGTVNVKNSLIALNTANDFGPDVSKSTGTLTSQGFNLIGKNDSAETSFPAGNPNVNNDIVGTSFSPIDPKLDPKGLQDNDGPTQTIALLSSSPAIDHADDSVLGAPFNLKDDQRGYPRRIGMHVDIGAFEFEFGGRLRIISIVKNGSDIVITFEAVTGATYRLERKLAITDSTWQSISGVSDLTASAIGPASFTDPGAISLGKAFYRVRLLP